MKTGNFLFCLLFVILPLLTSGGEAKLNLLLEKLWKTGQLSPVEKASDEVFHRRIHLNAAGTLPSYEETWHFLRDKSPAKREQLIDKILATHGYADMMTMRFADMLRIKSEFPINLWPNAVQAFHSQLRRDILADRSLQEMTMEMLTSSGSNFQIPYANTFRASADRTPKGLAKAIGRTFCGVDTSTLSAADQEKFAAFFSRIRYKSTKEWKEEIVYTDPEDVTLKAAMPDGRSFRIDTAEVDPRAVFAAALFDTGSKTFARAFVNKVWAWHFGAGLVGTSPDAMPPAGPSFFEKLFMEEELKIRNEILDHLAEEFIANKYSLKKLCRIILRSKAYQADYRTAAAAEYPKARKLFAVYPVRRVEAEVAADILAKAIGLRERYMSVIPEPFTYIPRDFNAVQIDDGSISSGFLGNFGRPSRDAGTFEERNNAVTDSQRLFLMNSARLYYACNRFTDRIVRPRRNRPKEIYHRIYMQILNRPPTEKEIGILEKRRAKTRNIWELGQELTWALVNTKEFLYHH